MLFALFYSYILQIFNRSFEYIYVHLFLYARQASFVGALPHYPFLVYSRVCHVVACNPQRVVIEVSVVYVPRVELLVGINYWLYLIMFFKD